MKKCFRIKILLAFSVLVLAGCQKEKEREISEDYDNLTEGWTEEAEGPVPSHAEFTVVDPKGFGQVTVDADVDAAMLATASIYNEECVEVDEAYLRELAEKTFDNGDYTVEKPYAIMSEEELRQEARNLLVLTGEEKEDIRFADFAPLSASHVQLWEIYQAYEYTKGTLAAVMPEDSCTVTVGYDGETLIPFGWWGYAQDTELATLRGLLDGQPYEILYGRGLWYDIADTRELIFRTVKPHTSCMDVCHTVTENTRALYGENAVGREAAVAEAEALLKRMGYTDYKLAYDVERICREVYNQYTTYIDGYRFYFVPSVGGMDNYFGAGMNLVQKVETAGNIKYKSVGQETITVELDHNGIISVRIGALYDTKTKHTEQPVMFEFSKIQSIFEDYVKSIYEDGTISGKTEERSAVISEIRLCYVSLWYEESYTLVPAWVFFTESDDSLIFESSSTTYRNEPYAKCPNAFVGINAVDGSILEFTED